MGWTYTHVPKGKGKAYLDGTMTCENENGKWEVVRSAFVGFREYYAAVRITKKAENKSYVFGVVCLVNYAPNSEYNFGYKDIDESMGPNVSRCPKSILDCLTPLDEIYPLPEDKEHGSYKYAKAWRERCAKNADRKKINNGDVVKLASPLSFTDGTKADTFVAVKDGRKLRWKLVDNHRWTAFFKIPARYLSAAEIVPRPA